MASSEVCLLPFIKLFLPVLLLLCHRHFCIYLSFLSYFISFSLVFSCLISFHFSLIIVLCLSFFFHFYFFFLSFFLKPFRSFSLYSPFLPLSPSIPTFLSFWKHSRPCAVSRPTCGGITRLTNWILSWACQLKQQKEWNTHPSCCIKRGKQFVYRQKNLCGLCLCVKSPQVVKGAHVHSCSGKRGNLPCL